MTTIVDRLAQATEGSRELDAEIARIVGWTMDGTFWTLPPNGRAQYFPPSYTTSLDAALMLVPEGWIVEKIGETRYLPYPTWSVCLENAPASIWAHDARTAALALCIAALRARMSDDT